MNASKKTRTVAWWHVGLAPAVGFLLTACGDMDGTQPDDTSERGDAINGTISTSGCDASAKTKLNDAMDLIMSRLYQSSYLECIKDAVWTGARAATPEYVLSRLRDNMPTSIVCQDKVCGNDSSVGCAGISDGPEIFTIKNDHVHNAAVSDVAATIVHEVAHRKNFGHPGSTGDLDYPFTVPVQAATCIRNTQADGLDRSHAPGDTTLFHVGGKGGNPFELRCPGGGLVTGMVAESSNRVNKLRIRCGGYTSPAAGSTKDSVRTRDRSCSAGQRVVGLWGVSSDMLDYAGMVCASEAALIADDPNPPKSYHSLGGGFAGTFFTRYCPTGMAVKGVVGRSGARIDQASLLCEDVDGKQQAAPHRLALIGSKNGSSKTGYCLGNGVMTALYGHAGAEVDRLGGSCHPTQAHGIPSIAAPQILGGNGTRHVFDRVGGDGGRPFAQNCGTGWAMVGLQVRSGARLDAVKPICAAPSQWSSSGNVVTWSPSSFAGGNTGVLRARSCPRGEYLVGLQTWAKKGPHATPTVHGVQPICRRLSYGLSISVPQKSMK